MNTNIKLDPEERTKKMLKIIKRLALQKEIKQYVLLEGDEEASRLLPGGLYPYSGMLLTNKGKVFSFWFDWDEKNQDYTLGNDKVLPDGTTLSYWREEDSSQFEKGTPQMKEAFKKTRQKLGL